MNGILKKDLRVVLTGVMIFISYQVYSNPESGTKEQGDVYRNLPFSMPEVSQPSFPDYEVNLSLPEHRNQQHHPNYSQSTMLQFLHAELSLALVYLHIYLLPHVFQYV